MHLLWGGVERCDIMNEKKIEVINLLKTARGQIDGIIKMLEENRYCVDISKQIIAVQGILKKANLSNLEHHIRTCVIESIKEGNGEQKIKEVIDLIEKYIK